MHAQMTDRMLDALEHAAHDEAAAEVLRFPLSLSDLRLDVDRKGEACHVLDVVLNSDVLRQAQAFRCEQGPAGAPARRPGSPCSSHFACMHACMQTP
jgi:hypothetical protein